MAPSASLESDVHDTIKANSIRRECDTLREENSNTCQQSARDHGHKWHLPGRYRTYVYARNSQRAEAMVVIC